VQGTRAGAVSGLRDLVRELSHAGPLDMALFAAHQRFRWRRASESGEADPAGGAGEMPFLAASRALVQFPRLSDRLARMAEWMESSELRDHTILVDGGSQVARVGLQGEVKLGDLGRRFREHTAYIGFFREADMATVFAE